MQDPSMHPILSLFRFDARDIPARDVEDFWREFFLHSQARMQDILRFLAIMYALIIVLVDALNLMNLPAKARIISFTVHSLLLAFALFSLHYGRRFIPAEPARLSLRHVVFIYGNSFIVLAFANILLYLISYQNINPAAMYLTIILVWSIAVVCNPLFGWAQLGLNFASSMFIISLGGSDQIHEPYVWIFSSVGTAAVGFSTRITFVGHKRDFLRKRQLEEEQKRILKLNDEIAAAYEEAEKLNAHLTETLRDLQEERRHSEELLLNVLPHNVAERLKSGETLIADLHREATILFADIVGFTKISAETSAVELVQMLNWVFSIFDRLTEELGAEKIKTIGDAYMAVAGAPNDNERHAEVIAHLAVAMQREARNFAQESGVALALRIGIHTGSVVAGVIGRKKFAYDLWGDAVNTASRMESHGEAGKIHISEETFSRLRGVRNQFRFEERGEQEIKGKGTMRTWFLYEKEDVEA